MARLFANQQAHDWLIIQSEALARPQVWKSLFPQVIVFRLNDSRSSLCSHNCGLLISRINGWSGPLFNMAECPLQGEHHAENVMAAAVLVEHVEDLGIGR